MFKPSTYITLFIISLAVFYSCSDDTGPEVNCYECIPYVKATGPDNGLVTIKVTINNENPTVPIVIYDGKFKGTSTDAVVLDTIVSLAKDTFRLPIGPYYSAKATYKSGTKIIHAIDGEALKKQKSVGVCDVTCWTIYGGNIDVRLKY
jgi:hypothetical protein